MQPPLASCGVISSPAQLSGLEVTCIVPAPRCWYTRVSWRYANAVLPHLQHRTVSTDYLVVQEGTPTFVTPDGPFNVVDGKGTYRKVRDTVCKPGDIISQRGNMHA